MSVKVGDSVFVRCWSLTRECEEITLVVVDYISKIDTTRFRGRDVDGNASHYTLNDIVTDPIELLAGIAHLGDDA